MYGYAFCHASRYRVESWHGGRGQAPKVCQHIFEMTPPKIIQRPSCFRNALQPPNLVGRPPDLSVKHSQGMQGSTWINQGSNCLGMPNGNQIWQEESLTRVQYIDGVKGQAEVSQGQQGVKLLMNGNQIWKGESLTEMQYIDGVKGHAKVSWGQIGVKLLRNALW